MDARPRGFGRMLGCMVGGCGCMGEYGGVVGGVRASLGGMNEHKEDVRLGA